MTHSTNLPSQRGATLIEVLVTMLILSMGLLAMGAMMAYSSLLPKFSGNRSVAVSTASNMIDRMRANPTTQTPSFSLTAYNTATFSTSFTPSGTLPAGSTCSYPSCTQTAMANMDIAIIQQQLSQQLSPAGITIAVTDAANNEGNLWVIWQEPSSIATLSTGSDNCPAAITALGLSPAPRCVYMPFKL
ncbi:type IV pilus modification protein PilV [Polaromonas sp.]|uniref:type IV pilus modification protein PilV n=1 Tax=Polaromonas sp. TaxID=1869339 RepID=UPI0025E4E98F|nr:type IV pilus modification protein PilV [Polaromonas sp.]